MSNTLLKQVPVAIGAETIEAAVVRSLGETPEAKTATAEV